MKVTNEKTENSQAFLTIEMEPAEVEESLDESYRRLVKTARIPGFRRGKAPRAILERHIGKERFLEEALNDLFPQAYEKAIKEQDIEAIARPQVEIAQTDPVIFKAIVPLKPKVELGDYRQLQLTPEAVAVTGADTAEVIEQLRHRHATWEPVERPADFGDLVVLDIESNIEGRPFINQKGAQYQIVRDIPFPAPGFAEQLAGTKKDEEKEFKLQLPADHPRGELAGKEPLFRVKVSEIKQEILPELNDEFASQVNADYKTVKSLRQGVHSDLKLRAGEKARVDFEERVIDAVVELAELEFPPILVELEIDRMLNQRFQRGRQELEEYLRDLGKTDEELREELRPSATTRTARSLVLGKVVEAEQIEVSDSDIDTEIENMTKSATDNKDELVKVLNTPQARESIKQTLLARKAVERLVEVTGVSKVTKRKRKREAKK